MSDRVTVRPPFDPVEFARESERVTLPPPPALPSEAPEVMSGTIEIFVSLDEATIPRLAVALEDLEWFDLPPVTRSVLELVDGESSIEAIGLRAGVSLVDAVEAISELARQGIVTPR